MENSSNFEILVELKKNFNANDYDRAIKLLQNNKQMFEPGVYEYNLGLAHFKNKNFPVARLHFEHAKKNGFYSDELAQAHQEVLQELEVYTLEESQSFNDHFNNIVLQLPVDIYLFLSLIFITSMVVFYKKLDKYFRFILTLCSVFPIVFYIVYVDKIKTVLVMEDQVIYSGPSTMFEQIQIIPKGMKVNTGKRHADWQYIISPESHKGWFHSELVEKL